MLIKLFVATASIDVALAGGAFDLGTLRFACQTLTPISSHHACGQPQNP